MLDTKTSNVSLPDFSNTEIAFSHLSNGRLTKAWWLFRAMNMGWLVKTGAPILNSFLHWGLPVKWVIKGTIYQQFCGGETIQESLETVEALGKSHIGSILDYSVEGEKTEAGFDACLNELLRVVEEAHHRKEIPFAVFKVSGLVRTDLLAKAQKGSPLSDIENESLQKGFQRVDKLCRQAYSAGVRIFIDAEESWIQTQIDDWALEMMGRYNQKDCIVFNTYQMYRHESLAILKKHLLQCKSKGLWFGAKLVRGAYMETERRLAKEGGYLDPIQPNKQATDRDYDLAVEFCLENIDRCAFCAGTHNEKSTLLLAKKLLELGLSSGDERIWFSQLLGMSDNISYNLAAAGFNVAKYVPYGPVASVMPYLIRRAHENSAIAGQSSREFNLIDQEQQRRKRAK